MVEQQTSLTLQGKKLTSIVELNEKCRQKSHIDLRKGQSVIVRTLASTMNLGVKFPLALEAFAEFRVQIEDEDLFAEAFVSDNYLIFKNR